MNTIGRPRSNFQINARQDRCIRTPNVRLVYAHDTRTGYQQRKPVPENRYRKAARKESVSYLLPETGTRKIWYQIACQTRQKLVGLPIFWYRFLVPISGKCVMGIIDTHIHTRAWIGN